MCNTLRLANNWDWDSTADEAGNIFVETAEAGDNGYDVPSGWLSLLRSPQLSR
jgi:hypothetical protein